MLEKAKSRTFLFPALIILAGSAIAFGVFVFSDYARVDAANVGISPQWTQETGLGSLFPACGSSSNTFPTCSGGSPTVTINWAWTPNASHAQECNLVNAGIYKGGVQVQGYAGRACNDSVTWTGGESGTVYTYNVYFLEVDGNPAIETASGSFTTPYCSTPVSVSSCSVSPATANIGEDVTWTATPQGGLALTTPKQEWVGDTTNGGWAGPPGGDTAILARRFQANENYNLKVVSLDIAKESTVTGTLWVTIESDARGVPSGSVLPNGTSPTISETQVSTYTSYGWTAFYLNNTQLVAGTNYWIVLRGSLTGPAYKIIGLDTTAADPNPGSLSLIHSWGAPAWTNTGASYGYRIYAPTYTYLWSGDAPLGGQTVNPATVQYPTDGSKSGSVTVSDGFSNASASCGAVTVNPLPEPDLIIQSPSLSPASPIVSQSVTFSGTVANTGTGAAGASQTRVRVDLNNNGWIAGEPELTNPTGALAAGGGTEAESFAPWAAVLGTHSYQICADSGSAVAESNEGNNCSAPQTFTVSNPPPQANLIVDPHSATPSSVVVGSNVTIQGRVRNQGGAGAGQSNTRLRVDIGSDGSWDTTQNAATGALASSASELEQWTLTVGSVGPRTYEICADSTGTVFESNEADNCVTGTYSGVNPPPDLIIQSPSMNPGSPLVNQAVTFQGTLLNQGGSVAGASDTRLRIDLNNDGWTAGEPEFINPAGAQGIGGMEGQSFTPWTAVLGTHSYQICADSGNAVTESDEGNNCTAFLPFSVGVPVLSISLSASPPSPGIAPFSTTLTPEITSYTGNPSDTINYSLWWNCSQTTTNVGTAEAACGALPAPSVGNCAENSVGYKCNAVNSTSRSVPHTYATPTGSPFSPKVIIERDSAAPKEARIPITVSWPAIGGSCAVPPFADVGDTVIWSALGTGGDGNYTYEWYSMTGSPSPATCAGQPSLACQNFTTSYSTTGTKSGNVRIRSAGLTPYETACSNSIVISGKIISFGGTPPVIFSGGTATLSWTTTGYSNNQCTITGGGSSWILSTLLGRPPAGGSVTTPALTTTTTYRITCDDGTGPEWRDATIIVASPPTIIEIPP